MRHGAPQRLPSHPALIDPDGHIVTLPRLPNPLAKVVGNQAREAKKAASLCDAHGVLNLLRSDAWFQDVFVNADHFRHTRSLKPRLAAWCSPSCASESRQKGGRWGLMH